MAFSSPASPGPSSPPSGGHQRPETSPPLPVSSACRGGAPHSSCASRADLAPGQGLKARSARENSALCPLSRTTGRQTLGTQPTHKRCPPSTQPRCCRAATSPKQSWFRPVDHWPSRPPCPALHPPTPQRRPWLPAALATLLHPSGRSVTQPGRRGQCERSSGSTVSDLLLRSSAAPRTNATKTPHHHPHLDVCVQRSDFALERMW